MKLLIINPNTSPAVTGRLAARAQAIAGPEIEIAGATGRFGARYISSRAAAAIAAHAALDALAQHGDGVDAVCLACFGDPGLAALKEISPVPVVGMAEASCHAAAMLGRRFAIVTGGAAWEPMLTEFVASLGFADRLARVRAVPATGGEIARSPEASAAALAETCSRCAVEDGADVVILGGAGLVGMAERLQPQVPAPLLCSTTAAIEVALALGRLRVRRPQSRIGSGESLGLSDALAAALAAGGIGRAGARAEGEP